MANQRDLEAMIRGRQCALCRTEPRVAWLPVSPKFPGGFPSPNDSIPHEYGLRCNCHPKPPTLEKRPKSELSKALADPQYATDSITRMTAERIISKRRDKS